MRNKAEDSSEQEQTTESNKPFSRTDRYLVASMLSGSRDNLVPLTPETVIGGATLRQIMDYGQTTLYLDLKSDDPLESVLVSLLVQAQNAATDCFNEARGNRLNLNAREVNLRYALKAGDLSVRLAQELEKRRARRAERERLDDAATGQIRTEVASGSYSEKLDGGGLSSRAKRKKKASMKLNGNGRHA